MIDRIGKTYGDYQANKGQVFSSDSLSKEGGKDQKSI